MAGKRAVATIEGGLPAGVPLPQALVKVMEGLSLGTDPSDSDIRRYISTQCALLDYVIGRPGLPEGRLTSIYGKEGSAKSSLVQHIMAEAQQMGGIAILSDSERRFSADRAQRIGLDLSRLIIVRGMTIERVFTDIEKAAIKIREADADIPVVVVVDSLAGLPSEAIMEEALDKPMPARVARFVSGAFTRMLPAFARHNITTVMVNQTRAHLEISNGPRAPERRKVMGERTAMIAENALLYWSTLMIHLTSTGSLGKDRDNPEGIEVRATIRKNSVGPEGRRCEFNVRFLDGIDREQSKLDLLVHLKAITQGGGWYEYEGEEKKFQRAGFTDVLAKHPELNNLIKSAPELWVTGSPLREESEDG